MVSVLASIAVDRGFEPRSGQTKDYIKLACVAFPLSTQSKDLLARNQDNVSEWGDIILSIRRLSVISVS